MSLNNNRILRINEDIQREMSMLLMNIKDPRVKRQGMISVTAVDTTTDLRHAKVYISVLAPESEKELMKGLKSASGYLRSEIGKALSLRYTPELQFEIDDSIARGARISTILSDLPDVPNQSTMLDSPQTADWLDARDNFLIITHRRPDGDTTGCAGALAQGLREYGKTAYILPNPEVTPRYKRFVEEYYAPEDFKPDNIITVDTASSEMLHDEAKEYISNIALCIDHHASNTKYAKYTCLDTNLASCGELVYEILIELAGEISPRTAECLYAAVTTDTGCFVYANTTANTLQVASYLVEAGAPQKEINKTFFRTKTIARIKIEGMIYSGIEFHFDGKVAIVNITREMMEKAGAWEDDVDDISALPIGIEGVRAGITLRELEFTNNDKNSMDVEKSSTDNEKGSTDSIKGSVRTMPGVNANEIAALFGGGGHPMAAGFSYDAPAEEVKEKLLEILPDFLLD